MEKNSNEAMPRSDQDLAAIRSLETWSLHQSDQDQEQARLYKYIKPLALACAGLVLTSCANINIGRSEKPNPKAVHATDNKSGKTHETPTTSPSMNTIPTEQPSITHENQLTAPAIPEGPAQTNSLFEKYPTWSQNFATKDSKLDSKYWNIYNGTPPGNHENEYYTADPTNLRIENGALNLVARQQKINNDYGYTSARIDTASKEDFLYGKIDITAKVPNSAGTWPAMWLLPVGTKYAVDAKASPKLSYLYGGEIDLLESVGSEPSVVYGVVHTLHAAQNNPGGVGDYNKITVPNNDTQFNKYGLEWTPTSIIISINDKAYYTYKKQPGADYTTWPFDQKFYLILNLALGGAWGGMEKAKYPPYGIDDSKLPAAMKIKSINYYPYVGPMPVPKKG